MSWRWTLRRCMISVFVVMHMTATMVWVIPVCPIRNAVMPAAIYYMLPLGLWQFWGMFAPDPIRDVWTLEADVADDHGRRHIFAFPKLADYSKWRGIPRFRHSKFAANLAIPDNEASRKIAAKHALRKLALDASAYPVFVDLIYQVRNTPPPGSPIVDVIAPSRTVLIQRFHFESIKEVQP